MDNRPGLPPGIARIAEGLCTIRAADKRRKTNEIEGSFDSRDRQVETMTN
jgi:hypothetical protein